MNKSLSEILIEKGLFLTALLSCFIILVISCFIFIEGLPAIQEYGFVKFLLGNVWSPNEDEFGVFSMIAGSLIVTFIALLISTPLSIMLKVMNSLGIFSIFLVIIGNTLNQIFASI